MNKPARIFVAGGGPAGICAALAAANENCEVTLFEQNEKIGKKLYITGKGRCNLTNLCDRNTFFEQIIHNPRFMYPSFAAFDQNDLMHLVEAHGCSLKTERGNRVFPLSDKSSDVIRAFQKALEKAGVKICYQSAVKDILIEEKDRQKKITGIKLKNGLSYYCDHLILAGGGLSYQSTGSDGSLMKIAEGLGHHIVPCRPALVGLITKEKWPTELQGLSLRNVGLTLYKEGKKISREQGEMLFTHFGVSGPMVLTASSRMDGDPESYSMAIDLKPALDELQLRSRLIRDFEKYQGKQLSNGLNDLLPSKLIPVFIQLSGISSTKKINQISRKERCRMETLLKSLSFHIRGFAPANTAIITAGGIDTKEINPKNMTSKIIRGLSFAGEMIDVDALTGGFNIQIAASTGWLAGKTAGEELSCADSH